MDHAAFETHIKRLEDEAAALTSQLKWFNRAALVLGLASLPGALVSLWVPALGIFFAVSLAGTAKYIGTVHLQSTHERIADLRAKLND